MKYIVILVSTLVASTLALPPKLRTKRGDQPSETSQAPSEVSEQVEIDRDGKAYGWNKGNTLTFRKVPVSSYPPAADKVQVSNVPVRKENRHYMEVVPIVKYSSDLGSANYNYNYETGNGISVEEVGELKQFENGKSAVVVKGSYRYVGADGEPVYVTYVADENGFQPQSDSIPPIPEAIVKSLEYNRNNPYKGEDESEQKYRPNQ